MISGEKQGNYLKDVNFGLKIIDDGGNPHHALINNGAARILVDPDGICEPALWLKGDNKEKYTSNSAIDLWCNHLCPFV